MSEKLRNGNARRDRFKVLLCAYCKAKSANARKFTRRGLIFQRINGDTFHQTLAGLVSRA